MTDQNDTPDETGETGGSGETGETGDPGETVNAGVPDGVPEEFDTVRVEVGRRVDGVATVTIDRPETRNALNTTVRSELIEALGAVEDNEAARAVVLTGAPESGAFVAGADVGELRDRDLLAQREAGKPPRVYETVATLDRPVVAAVNGHALGGGCELAQACDVRIARAGATLGQPEIDLGLMPGGGATQRLPRLVGPGNAAKLVLTGERVDAAEAQSMGLVDEVHEEADFEDRVYEIAGAMAEKSPVALSHALRALRASQRLDLEAGIEYEKELFVQLFATEDMAEGIDAFFENREPEWTGR